MNQHKPLTYRDAGVDIDAGNALVGAIKNAVASTRRPGVVGDIGGFGGLFRPDLRQCQDPLLVAGTDGVGTKLKLALELNRLDTIGIDLVAMCVNDVIVQGAEPLFFLDYYATGSLNVDQATQVVGGIATGCRQAGAALLGGETAEMPGLYQDGDFDLAGFCVGLVDRPRLIDGSGIRHGDQVLGLASSGPHSNGYSLIRRVLERVPGWIDQQIEERAIADCLIEPTRIYVRSLLKLLETDSVTGIAHVTGGGLAENLARVLPGNVDAAISLEECVKPPVFSWLQEHGDISEAEMRRTFNCGVGMVVVVEAAAVAQAISLLTEVGETVYRLGEIQPGDGQVRVGSLGS